MTADILRTSAVVGEDTVIIDEPNEWVLMQDPDSGEIIRNYVPVPDNPATPDVNETLFFGTFKCMARGIISTGLRMSGTTETFGASYESEDYVRLWFPSTVTISKRDQITNIRDSAGNVIWKEEEVPGSPPTVFNVLGVTPLPNPFGKVLEYQAMLERADKQ